MANGVLLDDRVEVSGGEAAQAVTLSSTRHSWFAIIWLIYLIDYADRFAVSAVLPAIQEEFSLNDAQLGLMSGSLFLGLAVLAVPCGLAVDRFSRKYMITAMTLVWSIATWSTGLAKSFAGLVVARIVVGAGEAGYNPAGYALIAAWYPERMRGTMVGLFNMAQPLGIGLGIVLAGHLTAEFGWRAVFGVLAVSVVCTAFLQGVDSGFDGGGQGGQIGVADGEQVDIFTTGLSCQGLVVYRPYR